MHELVLNQAVMTCCGRPRRQCTCRPTRNVSNPATASKKARAERMLTDWAGSGYPGLEDQDENDTGESGEHSFDTPTATDTGEREYSVDPLYGDGKRIPGLTPLTASEMEEMAEEKRHRLQLNEYHAAIADGNLPLPESHAHLVVANIQGRRRRRQELLYDHKGAGQLVQNRAEELADIYHGADLRDGLPLPFLTF